MAKLSEKSTNNIIDLDLSVTKKKRFRFNNDDSRMVDINIADMGVISRLSETYPKFEEWIKEVQTTTASFGDTEEDVLSDMDKIGETLTSIDKKMRDAIDYIFDAPVSQAVAPDGSMYDLFNGQFRFEYILVLLLDQYENNLSDEFKKMQKHTAKYTKKG